VGGPEPDGANDGVKDAGDDETAGAVSERNATTSPTCGSEQSENRTSVTPTLPTVNEVMGRPSAAAPVTSPTQSPTAGALDRTGAYGVPATLIPDKRAPTIATSRTTTTRAAPAHRRGMFPE
jgi:hypothetical protein